MNGTSTTGFYVATAGTALLAIRSAWLPIACAVHCLLTPILPLALPALELNATTETVLMAGSLLLTGRALQVGWRKHRNARLWICWLTGAAAWVVTLLGLLPEWWGGTLGAGLVSGAALYNAFIMHRSTRSCDCPVCEGVAESATLPPAADVV